MDCIFFNYILNVRTKFYVNHILFTILSTTHILYIIMKLTKKKKLNIIKFYK